jgi:sugar phosphate isomerase/epimerase
MKFGIVSDEIDRDFAAAVRLGKGVGIERYEVRSLKSGRVPFCDAAELREVERIAAGEGVEITALSPGLFKLTDDSAAFAAAMSEVYPRAAELALRWRLRGLIVFGFHKPGATEENFGNLAWDHTPQQVTDWFTAANERAANDGLMLMIEPEPICWVDTCTAAVSLIQKSGGTNLGINYDPGNVAWFSGEDPIGELRTAAPHIANCHVKDLVFRSGGGRPEFVPAGCGMIDYRAHFAGLIRAGYAGPISLEPHMDGSLETIQRCKAALEQAYESDTAAGD